MAQVLLDRSSAPLSAMGGSFLVAVAGFGRARRRVQAIRFAGWGLVVGGVLAAILGSVAQYYGLDGAGAIIAVLLTGCVGGAGLVGWLRTTPPTQVALEIDHHLGLDERVTTALELADRLPPPPRRPRALPLRGTRRAPEPPPAASAALAGRLAAQQVADTLDHLRAVTPGQVYPVRLPRRELILVAVAAALAILPWVIPWPAVLEGQTPAGQITQTTRAQAAQLDTLANQLTSQPGARDPAARAQLASQLRQAAASLRQSGADAQQATSALASAQQAAAAAAPQTGEDAALTLARIADALNTQPVTQGVTRALDQQNTAAAAAQLNQLAAGLGQLSPAQRQSLAAALQAASNAARGSDTNAAAQFQQAATAAQKGNAAGLQQAAQALQQLGAASQAQQDATQVSAALQTSRAAIAQAAQASLPSLASQSAAAASGMAANSGSTAASAAGQSATAGASPGSPSDQAGGNSPASQPGAGNAQSGDSTGGAGSGANAGNGNQGESGASGGGTGAGSPGQQAAPDFQGLAAREVVVPTNQSGQPTDISPSNQLQTGVTGQARVDYLQVLPQYRQQALQAIDSNAVPNGLKGVVKGYFDSLAPK